MACQLMCHCSHLLWEAMLLRFLPVNFHLTANIMGFWFDNLPASNPYSCAPPPMLGKRVVWLDITIGVGKTTIAFYILISCGFCDDLHQLQKEAF